MEHVWIKALYRLSESVVASRENVELHNETLIDLKVFEIVNQLPIDRSALMLLEDF